MAKPIMIQGTMSNAGKSLAAAGLCRIFKQDGYRTAPFKSQNMALNSYITSEGLEIGRAQAVQAQAAGEEPVSAMNPILLKPASDTGSQVIVNGKVLGNMPAKEYFAFKQSLIPEIEKAYHRLDASYDIIVIEGAGSPAEINLKQNDIVNMGLAEMVDAPVLLIGDIDRGGVFAQLIGTLMLLEKTEQERVKGLLINKFRGDRSMLEPGIEMLVQRSGKPVLGVLPYMQVDIEDEDSLSSRFACRNKKKQAAVTIAVIRLPRISNFTDFQILETHPLIELNYVTRAEELGTADMVILPGTKNTMGDLKWLRESGLEAALLKCHEKGAVIMGICGGYQMLGQAVSDPVFAEEGGRARGIGLLPVETVFDHTKICTRVNGTFANLHGVLADLSGLPLQGYEIHMGHTMPVLNQMQERYLPSGFYGKENCFADITAERTFEKKTDGWQQEQVYGTYVHGVFDGEGIADRLVRSLAAKRGEQIETVTEKSQEQYREEQFDKLAEGLREHLDLEAVYRIMGV